MQRSPTERIPINFAQERCEGIASASTGSDGSFENGYKHMPAGAIATPTPDHDIRTAWQANLEIDLIAWPGSQLQLVASWSALHKL